MSLWTDELLESVRALSDSTLTDTCNLKVYNAQTLSNPNMTNRGGPLKEYIATYTNLPCRMDVNITALLPQRSKANIDVSKVLRIFYLSLSNLITINYTPKEKDIIESAAGNLLGNVSKYTILEVDLESDEIDCILLVEMI